jgi:Tol biopolymer transport system component/C-terminal processing protease CtpA/Prc
MRRFIITCLVLLVAQYAISQQAPKWLRYPAISPDGKTIVFSYKGDLYKVAAAGGDAVPLTLHEAYDYMPVWSRDGKYIAFASDRFGNFDVYIMPSTGGEATRLTYHSANDFPYDFTPDGKEVVFGTTRNDIYTSARFPNRGLFQKLYKVPVGGGRSVMYLSAGSEFAHFNSKGDQLVFQDRKGYEDAFRKHHTSAVTRDIWIYDTKAESYQKVSGYEGEDREPVFSSDDQYFYYLSEKNGSTQNIYKAPVKTKIAEQQLTKFSDNPVRFLSRSNDNTLCFTYDGEIYTLHEGQQPKKVDIRVLTDGRTNEKIVPVNKDVTQTALSPNGKEIAFVVRGEVFVTSVEGGITKRITNTPQQERMVEFSPDGRSLLYATERGDSWDIYQATIARKEEPYFYASTVIKEEPLIATEAEEFQPLFSPDGKEVAYLEERNILKVYNIASKKSRTLVPAGVNFSYQDGDQDFRWSPDGKYISLESNEGLWPRSEVALIRADGSGNRINLTESGFYDGVAKWGFNGKALLWATDRDGKSSLALQGPSELDIYVMFFDQELYDRFKLNKDDYALLKEKEENEKKEKKDTALQAAIAKKEKDWKPLLENLDNRKVRLTINSANISDYYLSSEGDKLYYLARGEKGYDLWVTDTRTRDTKVLSKLDGAPGGLDVSKDGKNLFVVSGGRIAKIEVATGKVSPIGVQGEMTLNEAGERQYIFDHAWRQVTKKFFDPKLQGVNWKMYRTAYEKFLPYINNNYDFQELLSELLGELNASHTGGRYARPQENTDVTASLGLLYDEMYGGDGVKVMEVIEGGPLLNAKTKIEKGVVIEKIDGEAITANIDWSKLLNRKDGKNVLLNLYNPATKERWEEVIKPISQGQEQNLLYQRWVKNMRKQVEEMSGGKVGYVHVQGMNDGSFRTVFEEVLGKNATKEALIVDTRFNGGGWLHDDLVTFLAGKRYLDFSPQGVAAIPGEPGNKWSNPSCVLMSESNYSDAFIFPYAYKSLGIGKLIGMPVAGTGTAVWWERQIDPSLVFGIPMVATIGKEKRPTENLQLEPDIRVLNDYSAILKGKDQQLERAVKEMLEEIKNKATRKGF